MFKQPPFESWAEFAGALVKAVVLVAFINVFLLLLGINPVRQLIQLNTYGLFDDGRQRLVYPSDLQNGQLPVGAQLRTHAIHYQPPAGEFRVVVLGESGIAGWGLTDEQTLTAQLNAMPLTVEGQPVRVYNLAYPAPSAPRDVVIMEAALAYQPDLILWFVTAASLDNSERLVGANRVFFNANRTRVEALLGDYRTLDGWYARQGANLIDQPPWWHTYSAIREQELLPVWARTLFYPFTPPELAMTDVRVGQQPLPDEARFMLGHPGFEQMPNPTWDWLDVGCRHALNKGAQLTLINRPVLVGEGAEEVYNSLYGVALYDAYREAMLTYTTEHNITYLDLWDLIPPEHYTDTPLHADAQGYGILAAEIAALLDSGAWRSACE